MDDEWFSLLGELLYKSRTSGYLLFAVQPHSDPFPAKVHHLSEFEKMVVKHGITDVYCVFLNLALSLLGENVMGNEKVPGSNSLWSIRETIEKYNLQLHTTLYPGGGLDPSTPKNSLSD